MGRGRAGTRTAIAGATASLAGPVLLVGTVLLALLAPASGIATAAARAAAPEPAHGHEPPPTAKPAPTSHGHTIYQSRHLWATVDLCNTATHPHMVGVRGSMPGSGRNSETMYMRFRLQYRDSHGIWRFVGAGADSGFVAIGASTYKARQGGRDFTIALSGSAQYVVRGVVTFEWRRRGHVVRNAQKETTAGHRALAGADPPDYSAAACELS